MCIFIVINMLYYNLRLYLFFRDLEMKLFIIPQTIYVIRNNFR